MKKEKIILFIFAGVVMIFGIVLGSIENLKLITGVLLIVWANNMGMNIDKN